MDNELSTGAMIAIELMVLSAVIGIVMSIAGIGQQFQMNTLTSVNDVVAASYGSDIETISEYEDLPAATVYMLLEKNADIIQSVTGRVERTLEDGIKIRYNITSKESLLSLMDLRVKTITNKTKNATYNITIKSVT